MERSYFEHSIYWCRTLFAISRQPTSIEYLIRTFYYFMTHRRRTQYVCSLIAIEWRAIRYNLFNANYLLRSDARYNLFKSTYRIASPVYPFRLELNIFIHPNELKNWNINISRRYFAASNRLCIVFRLSSLQKYWHKRWPKMVLSANTNA